MHDEHESLVHGEGQHYDEEAAAAAAMHAAHHLRELEAAPCRRMLTLLARPLVDAGQLKAIFVAFDANGDGLISEAELESVFKLLNPHRRLAKHTAETAAAKAAAPDKMLKVQAERLAKDAQKAIKEEITSGSLKAVNDGWDGLMKRVTKLLPSAEAEAEAERERERVAALGRRREEEPPPPPPEPKQRPRDRRDRPDRSHNARPDRSHDAQPDRSHDAQPHFHDQPPPQYPYQQIPPHAAQPPGAFQPGTHYGFPPYGMGPGMGPMNPMGPMLSLIHI